MDIPRSKKDFEAALSKLKREFEGQKDNPGSYQSEKNERCFECMFTSSSRDSYRCTYCTEVVECTGCTHCHSSSRLSNSSYCQHSAFLSGCSYVNLSTHCHDCVFCFGCVGLVKKEFHILNQPFKKDVYFKIVKELEKVFGLKGRG